MLIYMFLTYLLGMSLLSLLLYAVDKHRAKRRVWRIPEKCLLGMGFCGGALGALLAMRGFHHKTKHWYFWAVNLLGLIWQLAVCVLLWLHVR